MSKVDMEQLKDVDGQLAEQRSVLAEKQSMLLGSGCMSNEAWKLVEAAVEAMIWIHTLENRKFGIEHLDENIAKLQAEMDAELSSLHAGETK